MDPVRLPVSMLFRNDDGPITGVAYAEATDDDNEVAVHFSDTESGGSDSAYIDPIAAGALAAQLLAAANAAMRPARPPR